MKHVKLFESFGKQTLPPADLSQRGETIVVFTIGDDVNVTLLPTEQAEQFIAAVKAIDPDTILDTTNSHGVAYVVHTEDFGFSFVGTGFEPKTANMDYWITGEDPEGLNPNEEGEESGNGNAVYVLKRGMVITASPQGHSGPHITITDIDSFLGEFGED